MNNHIMNAAGSQRTKAQPEQRAISFLSKEQSRSVAPKGEKCPRIFPRRAKKRRWQRGGGGGSAAGSEAIRHRKRGDLGTPNTHPNVDINNCLVNPSGEAWRSELQWDIGRFDTRNEWIPNIHKKQGEPVGTPPDTRGPQILTQKQMAENGWVGIRRILIAREARLKDPIPTRWGARRKAPIPNPRESRQCALAPPS